MIHIIVLNEDHLDKMGIYRIWFGHKYYIGSTISIYSRMQGHEKNICEGFLGIRRGKNSITNIVNHLNEHTYIGIAFMELICECDSEVGLVIDEQTYLYQSKGDSNCLNYEFEVKRMIDGSMYYGREMLQIGINRNKNIIDQWKDCPDRPYDRYMWEVITEGANLILPSVK